MKSLLIVYHSVTGAAHQMALALSQGAESESQVNTRVQEASHTHAAQLLAADAVVFVAPEMLGSVSGLMKDFFDRCYYPALGKMEGKGALIAVAAGSDGQGAVRQMQRILTGWRMREVAPPLVVCTHAQTPEHIAQPKQLSAEQFAQCLDQGTALATGLALGIY